MWNSLKNKTVSFLRWSEQYTKTDMVYLAKGGLWTWLGKGVSVLAGTVTAVAFANLLPKEAYGNYKYILAMAGILGAFTLNGLNPSIIRSVSRGFEGSLNQGIKHMLRWSGLVFFLSLVTAGYYYFQGNNLLAGGMLLIALFQPLTKTAKLYEPHLLGKKLFKTQNIYLIAWEITQAGLIIGALFLTNNPLIFIGILFSTNLLFAIVYLWRTLKTKVENKKTEKEMISFGKHMSVINLLGTGARHADKALTFALLGATPTAIYSFALLPIEKLSGFFRSINQIILPKLSNKPLENLKKTIGYKIRLAFLASIFTTIILILALPYIFQFLFPEYMSSVIYAQWLAIGLIFVPEILFDQALTAHLQKRALYKINISSNILKMILLVILIPLFGIWGAVYAVLSFFFFRALIKTYYFYK